MHNLAAPGYQTLLDADVPAVELPGGAGKVRVVAGPARGSLARTGGAKGVLLLCGEPIDEPIVGYGPFVINTQVEISQAIVARLPA